MMHRRLCVLAMAVPGLAAVAALGLPAAGAQAVAGQVSASTPKYSPSRAEWWLTSWEVPQQVWPLSEGAGVTVAVIDTGVQANVADLRGVVLPGADMLGDAGDGETDFDMPVDGHGTAVAVLIAGQGGGTGTVGIAPQAKILPVHADTPGLAGDTANIAAGIEYAASHGAAVINISLGPVAPSGTFCDSSLQDAVADALERGSVVVASAGDENVAGDEPVEPASCAGVLAVGGTEPNGSLWPDSVQQPYVSVAAPADDMVFVGRDGRYSTDGAGTSAAAPLAAGVAALIRSRYPTMPWYQVDQRLIASATPEGATVPNDGYGYGIIDPAKAVNAAAYPISASAPNPVYSQFESWLASPPGQAWARANGASAPEEQAPAAFPSAPPTASAGSAPVSAERINSAPAGTAAYTRTVDNLPATPHSDSAIGAAIGVLAALGFINIVVLAILGTRSRRRRVGSRPAPGTLA